MMPPRRQYVQARTRLYLQMSECWNAAARSLQRGPAHVIRLAGALVIFAGALLQLIAYQIEPDPQLSLPYVKEEGYAD